MFRRPRRWNVTITWGLSARLHTDHGHVFAPTAAQAIAAVSGAYPGTRMVTARRAPRFAR